jgi:hypothetical protein
MKGRNIPFKQRLSTRIKIWHPHRHPPLLQTGFARRPVWDAAGLNEKGPGFCHPVMKAGFIFIADRHPGSDGLPHFRDDPNQEPGSAPFKLNSVAFTRQGRRRSARRSAFVKSVHNYCYPPKGLAATRVFLAATGKTLGLGLEAQATAFIRHLSNCLVLGLPKTDSQKERHQKGHQRS